MYLTPSHIKLIFVYDHYKQMHACTSRTLNKRKKISRYVCIRNRFFFITNKLKREENKHIKSIFGHKIITYYWIGKYKLQSMFYRKEKCKQKKKIDSTQCWNSVKVIYRTKVKRLLFAFHWTLQTFALFFKYFRWFFANWIILFAF